MQPSPFHIAIAKGDIADLNERLFWTRWPDQLEDVHWEHGTDLAYLSELVRYWGEMFDWRRTEQYLNEFSHFTTKIAGQRIHFIHERAKSGQGMPLIITHGWPGCFAEMTKLIPLLTGRESRLGNPDLTFDVVVPSLPGYGFSGRPVRRGMNVSIIADLWAELMSELGYEQFAAQGGDLGAAITIALAFRHPGRLTGIHLNFIPSAYLPSVDIAASNVSTEENDFLARRSAWIGAEGGYAHIQATKPQTVAYALTDSPVGLAAWIVEKFKTWSDCGGDIESVFTKDDLLTNISIYWFTKTIASSFRLYRENRDHPIRFGAADRITVPTAVAHFPKEVWMPPRRWVERVFTDVRRWTVMPKGGHFAALEQPFLLADDMRAFFAGCGSIDRSSRDRAYG